MRLKHIFTGIGLSLLTVAAIVFISPGCEKEPERRAFPRVLTTDITDIQEGEAVFHGEILTLGKDAIKDHGFLYVEENEENDTTAWRIISLGPCTQAGPFSAHVTSGLNKPARYLVYAYAVTGTYKVLGTRLSFSCPGNPPPVITEVIPAEGTWGDTLAIRGEHFDKSGAGNKVRMNSRIAKILFSSDTLLKIRIPDELEKSHVTVEVSVWGKNRSWEREFTLLPPAITRLSPDSGFYSNRIIITGSNFYTHNFYDNEVWLEDQKCRLRKVERHRLEILLPKGLTGGWKKITVRCKNLKSTREHALFYTPPVLERISPDTGSFLDTVELTGKYFHPEISGKRVITGEAEAPIVLYTDTLIRFLIPYHIRQQNAPVILELEDSRHPLTGQRFEILPPVITSVQPDKVDLGDMIIIKGKRFNPNSGYNHILVNGRDKSPNISSGTTKLRFSTPYDINYPDGKLSLSVYTVPGLSDNWNNEILVYGPHIYRYLRDSGVIGEIVSLVGEHFNERISGRNILHLGRVTVKPTNIVHKTSISFLLPENTPMESESYITTNGQYSNMVHFHLRKAVITTVSPDTITQGTTITVTGRNFSPVSSYNKVTLSNLADFVDLISSSTTQLRFKFPEGTFDEGQVSLTLQIGVQTLHVNNCCTFISSKKK